MSTIFLLFTFWILKLFSFGGNAQYCSKLIHFRIGGKRFSWTIVDMQTSSYHYFRSKHCIDSVAFCIDQQVLRCWAPSCQTRELHKRVDWLVVSLIHRDFSCRDVHFSVQGPQLINQTVRCIHIYGGQYASTRIENGKNNVSYRNINKHMYLKHVKNTYEIVFTAIFFCDCNCWIQLKDW